MKIVCDACSAKYSISDDKVQGKVFKIRCKKCQNIIVVRGAAQAEQAAAAPAFEKETRVYDYGDGNEGGQGGDEQVWYVVIDQDQVGPLSVAEVQERFTSGQIDAETYIWRDTFSDWLPINQVDAFAGMLAGGAATGGGAAAVSSMFSGGGDGTQRSDSADLFSTGAARAAIGEDDDNDLFGRRGGAAAPVVHQAQAAEAEAAKMRGQRNENSVLFSLNNLAALASDSPKPAAAPSSFTSAPSGGGGGEGSGLIDIRSMASAYMGTGGGAGAAKKPGSAGIGSVDDLPVFSTASFSEPAVLMPMGPSKSANNNKILIALGAGVAVLGILVVVLLLRGGGSKSEDKVADNGASAKTGDGDKVDTADKVEPKTGGTDSGTPTGSGDKPSSGSATEPPKDPGSAAVAPPPSDAGSAAPIDTPVTNTKPDKPATPPKETNTKPKTTTTDKKPPKETTTTTAPPKETKPPKETASSGGACDEVSCVLDNYSKPCCAAFKKGGSKPSSGTTSKPAGGGDLPEALDRDLISAGMAKVSGKAQSCGGQSSAKGTVKVGVKVGGDGRVSSVSVKSTPDPALGNCVAAAVQKATFAKTQNGGSFSYPFTF